MIFLAKAIEINNLVFSYDKEVNVIDDISFVIEKGSYTTIIGHNGSGKSTIAKLIIGLLNKDQGEIKVDGIVLDEKSVYEIRQHVGIVFQNPDNQFIGASVRDDIAFGLENHKIPHEKMDDIINNYAKLVGMENFLDSEPTRLSGGQKQRVAIAGVLAMLPDIIILDEATSMLDPKGKMEIKKLVKEISVYKDITILSITHDIEEASKSDHVIVMDQGKIKMQGKPQDVLINDLELIKLGLDVPFGVKLSKELRKQGFDLGVEIDIEKVVEKIWQSNMKN